MEGWGSCCLGCLNTARAKGTPGAEAGPEAGEVAGTRSPRCLRYWKELDLIVKAVENHWRSFSRRRTWSVWQFRGIILAAIERKFISVLHSHTLFFNKKLAMFSFYFLLSDIWWFSKIKSTFKWFATTTVVSGMCFGILDKSSQTKQDVWSKLQ